jgi:hypothetical protein
LANNRLCNVIRSRQFDRKCILSNAIALHHIHYLLPFKKLW